MPGPFNQAVVDRPYNYHNHQTDHYQSVFESELKNSDSKRYVRQETATVFTTCGK